MLPRSFTAVVERNVTFDGAFTTEPYETAWASQARWFVHVLEAAPGASLEIRAQVSPEGLTWCDHEAAAVRHRGPGMVTLPLVQVGPWLRLAGTAAGAAKVIVYLTLRG